MSQIAADHAHHHNGEGHAAPYVEARRHVDMAAATLPRGAFGALSFGLMGLGVLLLVVLVATGLGNPEHALAAYHAGFMYVLGLCLGCLGLVMILHQFNAGWAASVRRQAENVAGLIWVPLVIFLPTIVIELFVRRGTIFKWMAPGLTVPGSSNYDPFADHKSPFLNPTFWVIRVAVYFGIWIFLSRRLLRLSTEQDVTGDRWLTARARFNSSWGLLLFALTTAFASFDWLMSLDYHWFSTMFGVYYFAGSILSAVALLAVVMCTLRLRGKLGNLFTIEHLHDLGKLVFAFTVFWAYITFCQYFLIWYSNIPEEAAFFNHRKTGGWNEYARLLVIAHFIVPFLILLIRVVKRNFRAMLAVGLWVMVAQVLDIVYIVRPTVHHNGALGAAPWLDVCGVLGPVCVFLGLVFRQLSANPLVAIKDPRLHEALEHKNYV